MLGINRISGEAEGYYLDAVAQGVDEYYRGVGEAPGWWAGTAAAIELDLDSEVGSDDLRAVWSGFDPRSGEQLGSFTNRTVRGFDLCWRAPKSVSLLYAFGSPEVSNAVREAHDAAVAAAFGYLEANAAATRKGHGGLQTEPVDGFVASMFRHRTSRSGDPHLHTHVLVANLARAADGKWRTLDGRLLFTHSKTAGHLYQAHLRHELTSRLGVEWGPVEKGTADIEGIDRSTIWAFSERRQQIVEHMDRTGFRTARAAEIATLETRPDKTTPVEGTIRDVWAAKATEVGFDPAGLVDVLGRRPHLAYDEFTLRRLSDELVGRKGVTEKQSTFGRLDVLRAIADGFPQGAPVDVIEQAADAFLSRPEVVPVAEKRDYTNAVEYSTAELLQLEERLLTSALNRQLDGVDIVDPRIVAGVLADRPTIGDDQAAMVERLCGGGEGVTVVAAAAGTGKTYALAAAHDAWRVPGFEVHGAAVAAKAARELEVSSGIPARTLTRLTDDLANGRLHLGPGVVLVIDEAGMAGTRQLAPILDAAEQAGAKVVLVGDPKQLPEIEAGGMLAALNRLLDPVSLIENRRQVEAWERDALDDLRCGDVARGLDALEANGRLVTGADTIEVREMMANDWYEGSLQGEEMAMVAIRRSDVDDLNCRARRIREANGELWGPVIYIDERPYQAGDEIVCLRNDYRLGVRNGDRATVDRVDPEQRTMRARFDDGVRTLPTEYLDDGHIAHAYATTIHKAQGMTVDRCLTLGTDDLYREAGYVALSRGRTANVLYAVGGHGLDEEVTHAPQRDVTDPVEVVRSSFGREAGKQLAVEKATPNHDRGPGAIERRRLLAEIETLDGISSRSASDDGGLSVEL
ncbi:MAG: relaxase domain-containing protein [Acidimicrobiia bacterium]|nr:relaxase domain-containing protein [Acidimicrobiia bacterium]